MLVRLRRLKHTSRLNVDCSKMKPEKGSPTMNGIALAAALILMQAAALAQVGIPARPLPPGQRASFDWDRESAAHLMRRAGFSASPSELEAMLDKGFLKTLDELIRYQQVDDSVMEAGLAAQDLQLSRYNERREIHLADPFAMNRWWLYRIVNSRRQLLEKMTLFWHDHFATSIEKVPFVRESTGEPLLIIQNRTLRRHALGNFKEMVREMARDPAMLVWLDNFRNFNVSPNENWARELMELFTMGVDEYTELDVREAARAFTGWTFPNGRRDGEFEFGIVDPLHDFGSKAFLGRSGIFDGDDIIDIIFEQEVTAEFIAGKIWEFFVYPQPEPDLIKDLARVFRQSDYDISALMRAVFRHPRFFSAQARRALVKSPVEFVAGFMREMELTNPLLGLLYLRDMNQIPFLPPDVGGWTSGKGWINTSTLLNRYNYTNIAITYRGEGGGQLASQLQVIDIEGMVERFGLRSEEGLVLHFVERMAPGDVSVDESLVLEEYLRRGDDGLPVDFDIEDPLTLDKKVRGLVYLMALLPVYQLN